MDNLNTHNISSLYEAFEPQEAFALSQRLEIHHTPKHGSWLDIAEIELSALGRQCLGSRRIDNLKDLNTELHEFMEVVHEYPDLTVHLILFNATIADGIPQKLEHNDIRWITVDEIPQYEFCPADVEILKKLLK